jgi:hypothetical protein
MKGDAERSYSGSENRGSDVEWGWAERDQKDGGIHPGGTTRRAGDPCWQASLVRG